MKGIHSMADASEALVRENIANTRRTLETREGIEDMPEWVIAAAKDMLDFIDDDVM